jgi:hypothetical protein
MDRFDTTCGPPIAGLGHGTGTGWIFWYLQRK